MELFAVLRKAPQSPHSFISFISSNPKEIVDFLQKVGYDRQNLPQWSRIEAVCKDSYFYDIDEEIDRMKFRIQYINSHLSLVSFTNGLQYFPVK